MITSPGIGLNITGCSADSTHLSSAGWLENLRGREVGL